MFLARRFLCIAVAVLAASLTAAEQGTPSTTTSVARSSSRKALTTVESGAFGVADIPRGGKKQVITASPFVSQTASIWMGLILALNSGFINGCALSGAVAADGSSQAVAAVTASWTNSAMGMAAGSMGKFGFLSKIIGSYMFGSFLAGYLEPKPSMFLVSSSAYGLPLAIAAGFTILAKYYLEDATSVKLGFYLLCMANGINNSVTSTMTGNLCRSAHFSGISSDMGTFLGQMARGNKANAFKLKVFACLAASFWTGGYMSYSLSKQYGASILYASAAVYLFMAGFYDKIAKSKF